MERVTVAEDRIGCADITGRRDGLYLLIGTIETHHQSGRKSMKSLPQKIRRFIASEDGPTAVEYAVMLALIVTSVWQRSVRLARCFGHLQKVSNSL